MKSKIIKVISIFSIFSALFLGQCNAAIATPFYVRNVVSYPGPDFPFVLNGPNNSDRSPWSVDVLNVYITKCNFNGAINFVGFAPGSNYAPTNPFFTLQTNVYQVPATDQYQPSVVMDAGDKYGENETFQIENLTGPTTIYFRLTYVDVPQGGSCTFAMSGFYYQDH